MKTKHTATLFAILAAALYAINIPLSKILLKQVEPTMMAAFLYLGAGLGLFLYGLISGEKEKGDPLTRNELPYTIGMIVLDIAAPILLMLGLGAACCWGLENNCTRMLSSKSSVQITTIKGTFSGLGSLVIALVIGEKIPGFGWILAVLLLGFVAYGLSINFYIKAQKDLGAAKTSAYYSIAPFLGVIFGILLLKERPGIQFYVGLVIMIIATVLMVKDTIGLQHTHEHIHTHTHEHRHGSLIHSHEHVHTHTHTHIHGAEETLHNHPYETDGTEKHFHTHDPETP